MLKIRYMNITIPIGQYIFVANFETFSISFIMVFAVFLNKIIHKKQLRYFGESFICLFLCGVIESFLFYLSFQNDEFPHKNVLQNFSTALLLSGWQIILCAILEIINVTKPFKRFHRISFYILLGISITLNLLTCANGLIFSYQDNILQLGPIWFLPLITIIIYVVLMILSLSFNFKKNIWDSISILFIIIVTILATSLQFALHQDFLITNALTIALAFYFTCLHVQYFRHDNLTMLHNRKTYFLDLKKLSKTDVTIVTIQITNLDFFINTSGVDGYEMAIISVANQMQYAFEKIGRIYRTRTNEMKVLCLKPTQEEVSCALDFFKKNIEKTSYMVHCDIEHRSAR